MNTSKNSTLYYVHDPMCSWCWGYRPTWNRLKAKLPSNVKLVHLVGGLAPDSDDPMPLEMQEGLQNIWRRIQNDLGTSFNFDFWTANQPRRSTYPACRAVMVADKLSGKGVQMIEAIQQAYYQHAMNPSDMSTLQLLASELEINESEFTQMIHSDAFEALFQKELKQSHRLPISGFPSLVLEVNGMQYPIKLDYLNEQTSIDDMNRYNATVSSG